jgi:hypothetical protein
MKHGASLVAASGALSIYTKPMIQFKIYGDKLNYSRDYKSLIRGI